ncbi:basic proline-rich protein-like [Myotis myotis]|uniref:basic proline-rich protein-like n=1 Tax=Myotis myotis TaxID=51298 RepID=UPI001749A8FA|nr:basic proline-rich protein-like [Myotis myotis]
MANPGTPAGRALRLGPRPPATPAETIAPRAAVSAGSHQPAGPPPPVASAPSAERATAPRGICTARRAGPPPPVASAPPAERTTRPPWHLHRPPSGPPPPWHLHRPPSGPPAPRGICTLRRAGPPPPVASARPAERAPRPPLPRETAARADGADTNLHVRPGLREETPGPPGGFSPNR